jgi:hypothetical protein
MTTTTILITFKDTGKGQANVSLLGPHGFDEKYDIHGDNSRDFELEDGLYSIAVSGSSGTTAILKVKAGGVTKVDDSCPPKEIEMNDGFTI